MIEAIIKALQQSKPKRVSGLRVQWSLDMCAVADELEKADALFNRDRFYDAVLENKSY